MLSVGFQYFFQMLFEAFIVSSFVKRDGYLPSSVVVAAHCCHSVPPPLLCHNLWLAADFPPFVPQGGRI